MSYPAQTTGLGVAAQIGVDSTAVTLSLTGTTTHQIQATVQDISGAVQSGTALTLTAAANASGGTTVYTGTITGGGSNAFAGFAFAVAGFTNAANNGDFICTASSTTTLTLTNAAGVSETHAGTATSEESLPLTFVAYGARNVSTGQPNGQAVVTVSATGLITAQQEGQATVEVSYPAFGNSVGNVSSSGNIMNGLPLVKIYKEITVQVNA